MSGQQSRLMKQVHINILKTTKLLTIFVETAYKSDIDAPTTNHAFTNTSGKPIFGSMNLTPIDYTAVSRL